MSRGTRWVGRFVACVLVLYALACVVIALAYRVVLYPVPHRPLPSTPSDATLLSPHALRFGPSDAALTIVFFHGNGELAEDGIDLARQLALYDYRVVLAEYPGYGAMRASSAPSEHAIYDGASSLLASLDVPNDHLVLMGFSLGTGVAMEMASRGLGRALVLLAPYTSIPDVAQSHVPFFPMRLLMRDRFDSLSKAPSITMPAFVAHGDADVVVPFAMGETLAHALPHGQFVAVPGGHHMDLFARDEHLLQEIIDFLISVTPI